MSAAAIAGTKVGTGYVDVQPKFARDFQETIGRKLNEALTPAMRKAGKQSGKGIAEGVGDRRSLAPVVKSFEKLGSEANAAIARGLRKRQASKNAKSIAGGLGLDEMSEFFTRARKDAERSLPLIERMATRLRTRLRPLGADFRAVGSSVRQLASKNLKGLGGELRQVASSFRGASRSARSSAGGFMGFDGVMARVNRSSQFFRNILRTIRWPVFIAGLGLSLQGLSALAAGAVAATSSLGSLSGLLVALPAAALTAAQAFGVLKLATAGVGDAVKAALDLEMQGGGQAVDVMGQQRDAAERVADAKRNLALTERQAVFATDDFRRAHEEARRELEDLRFAADEADESIEGAVIGLQRAKQELARTLREPDASALDVREAELGVEQAENDLGRVRAEAKRAREDYRSAQETGVKGMPQVVAAKRAEEDANRSVDDAQRDLTRAIEDGKQAMQEQGSAASAFHDKMAQLPPAAQKFVRVLVGMKGRLDVLRNSAAEGFFPGAEDGLKGLMGNFKEVRGLVSGTAGVLGKIAAKAGKKLGSAVWGKDLSRLGKLNDRILGRLGDTTLNLADALRHVMVAAEPFLDWMSAGTEKLSALVMEEAAAGRESGRLAEFFDRTRETMERVGTILKGVGGALLNISEAARPLGNEILDSLGGAAEGWRKWTDSTKGQNRLKAYFTESKPAIFEMGRLIRDVTKTFFELGKQRGVAHLLRLVRTELVPAFRDLVGTTTGWASDFLKDFGALRDQGVPTFDAFLRTLAEHAGETGWKIAKALGNAFVHSNIWGKLAISGFLLAKFGGLKAFAKLGLMAGRALGKAMIGKLAPTIAAEMAAGSKLGEILSTRMYKLGKIGGRRFAVGLVIGIVTAAYWVGKELGKSPVIRRWAINAGENFVNALIWAVNKGIRAINDTLDATNILGKLGVDAPEIGEIDSVNFHSQLERQADEARKKIQKGFIDGPGGSWIKPTEIPAPKTDKAIKGLERFRFSAAQEGERTRKALKGQLDQLPGTAERSGQGMVRQMLPRLETLATQGAAKARDLNEGVSGGFQSLSGNVGEALKSVIENTRRALKTLGVKKTLEQFALKNPKFVYGTGTVENQARQQGGFIVPGSGSGDTFKTMLPVGSFVENREATRRLPFQDGGMVPVALEPGERVHLPERVRKIGAGVLRERNELVPRFRRQKGGAIGKEPVLSGPTGALRSLGQGAIKKVFEGAKDYLGKNKPGLGGALGDAPGQLGALERLASNFGLVVTSGYRPGDDGYHGINRARDFGGPPDKMLAFAVEAAQRFGRRMLELIHTPLGWGIKDGHRVGLNFWGPEVNADHYDHVHGAMQRGGLVGKLLQRFQGGGFVNANETQKNVALEMAQNLLPRGLNFKGAAGVIGNAWRESLWNPASEGTGGGGLYGFTAGEISLANLKATAERAGRPWTNIDFQNDFMWEGPEPASRLKGALNSQPSAAAAAELFDSEWERSGIKAMSDRKDGAREAMRLMADAGMGSAEDEPAAKEDLPSTYQGASTGRIDFGPMPKNLEGVNKEIAKREGERQRSLKAKRHAEKNGKSGVAEALGRNVVSLEERLRGLRGLRTRLRLEKAKKQLTKRLKGVFGKTGGYEQMIAAAAREFTIKSQDAEQLVALEPQPDILPANATDAQREAAEKSYVERFTAYLRDREEPAYQGLLGKAGDWRNTILRAQSFGFGKGNPSVVGMQNQWENKARFARIEIDHIKDFAKKVTERVKDFRGKKGNEGKPLPALLQDQVRTSNILKGRLPGFQLEDSQLTEYIGKARELFYPGGEKRLFPPPKPLAGTGSLEGDLIGVQGTHWPGMHELLGSLPAERVAGKFGGDIWAVQTLISELGLKLKEASASIGVGDSGDSGNSELLDLEKERTRLAGIREAIINRLSKTKELFDATYPVGAPFSGKFHSGGTVPGPWERESLALVRGEERIRTPEQELEMASSIRDLAGGASSAPEVVLNLYGNIVQEPEETRQPEVFMGGERLPLSIRQAPVTGRRTPGGGKR